MNKERRRTPVRARGHNSYARSAAKAVAAVSLFAGAIAWAAQNPIGAGKPGELLSLPAQVVRAPLGAGAAHLAYLSRAGAGLEDQELAPVVSRIAAVLRRYAKDPGVAERAASAVVSEASTHHIDPMLLVGLMLTENAKIEPAARSNVGATGLMQIMPFHSGKWGCGSGNLVSIESNICHGVHILADLIKRSPSVDRALLRYNGCVRGRNTPHCHTYPQVVRGYAKQVSAMVAAVGAGRDIRTVSIFPDRIVTKRAVKRPTNRRARRSRG